MFYLYRLPINDDEFAPILVAEFSTTEAAENRIAKLVDSGDYFENDFFITNNS